MLQFKYPGVYTREIPSGTRTITGAPTAVALFVGPTRSGIDNRRIRILSFADFERQFGGLSPTSSLSYSVVHFFNNGGGEAFIIRVPTSGSKAAISSLLRDDAANNTESIKIIALSSGAAGNDFFVEIDPFGIAADPFSTVAPLHDKKRFNLTVLDRVSGRIEQWRDLSTSSNATRFAPSVVNDPDTGSKLVKLDIAPADINNEGPQATGTIYKVGNALAAGNFPADVKVVVKADMLDDTGAANSGASVTKEVTVFANGSAMPTSIRQWTNKIVSEINTALRADQTEWNKISPLVVEAAPFTEVIGGAPTVFVRFKISAPGPEMLSRRIADAQVTLADPGGGATGLMATYALTQEVANPSRYKLGAPYSTGQVFGTPQAGTDGIASGQPDDTAFKNAVVALGTYDPFFNILCLPDVVRPKSDDPTATLHTNAMDIYSEAARICSDKHAFLLVDPFPSVTDVGSAESWKSIQVNFQSNHAAAFFPNIRVDDPLVPGTILSHPPSGAIAGMIARTDGQFGVWTAPAGTDAVLSGVYGPAVILSDAEHGILNPLGLNIIRQFPVFGTVNFGSRTLDGSDAMGSEWKYIPVRRTASYILRSVSEALRVYVHKPNGESLWAEVRMSVNAFLQRLFRQGAFKGTSARDAYFVLCDSSTTSAEDLAQGVVNVVIGVALLRPAEFVVVKLRQIVQPAA